MSDRPSTPSTGSVHAPPRDPGRVITFYSYKGGVGRSMAMANVAALLARAGKRVLVVDWDLEAPGIEKYFQESDRSRAEAGSDDASWIARAIDRFMPGEPAGGGKRAPASSALSVDPGALGPEARKNTPGLVDLIQAWRRFSGDVTDTAKLQELLDGPSLPRELHWEPHLLRCRPFSDGEEIRILSAGQDGPGYVEAVQGLDWKSLFEKNKIGLFFEHLRDEWKSRFDFVLIDSRTGLSDSGSICTALLPDQLVVFFTANYQSVAGVLTAVRSARAAQESLPVPRSGLEVVPVPARDEPYNEKKLSDRWRALYARAFAEFYEEWGVRPPGPGEKVSEPVPPAAILNRLYIPYASYWSYGERLPVLDTDERENPAKIGAAFGRLATLIGSDLNWSTIESGRAPVEVERARSQAERAQQEAQATQQQLEMELQKVRRSARRRLVATVVTIAIVLGLMAIGFFSTYSEERRTRLIETTLGQISRATDAGAIPLLDQLGTLLGKDDPRLLKATWDTGKMLAASDQYTPALTVFDRALESATDPATIRKIRFDKAAVLVSSGKVADGIDTYARNLELDPGTLTAAERELTSERLAQLYETTGRFEDARQSWKTLIGIRCPGERNIEPACMGTRSDYARFLIRNGFSDGKQGPGLPTGAAEALRIITEMLGSLEQATILTDPRNLDFRAASRTAPALKEALRAYEFLLRTRNEHQDAASADVIAAQIKRLDSNNSREQEQSKK